MNRNLIASELLKAAKEVVSYDREFDLASRKENYEVVDKVVRELGKIGWVSSAGASDGFNDESTFSFRISIKWSDTISDKRGRRQISEFVVPLRAVASTIKRVLKSVRHDFTWDNREFVAEPVLDSKIHPPAKRAFRDEYGDVKRFYENEDVNFDVYMRWNAK